MSYTIALAGKGGTGKTTLAGFLIKYLLKKDKKPILAVDADSNPNLNEVLGISYAQTLSEAREEMKRGEVPSGMTKDVFMSMKLEEAIEESEGYDLVVMGQPEGKGCYCAANTLLTNFLDKLTSNYPLIVMDNEAGMEHISRLTTSNVDILIVVADTSRRGLQAAQRIHELAQDLNIGVGAEYLVLNHVKLPPDEQMLEKIGGNGLNLAGMIYEDELVHEFDRQGKPTLEIPEDNQAVQSAYQIFETILK